MTTREERAEDEALDWFLRLTSGAADDGERARFEAWHKADRRHADAFAAVEAIWADADALGEAFAADPPTTPAAPTAPAAPAATRPRPMPRAAPRPTRRRWRAPLAVAAVAVLALLAGPEALLRLQADHRTGVGEQAQIVLADGSRLHLNTDTAIALELRDTARRITLLSGEAIFDVAHDPDRPFTVTAGSGQISALGTSFRVRLLNEGGEVAVTEGRVAVDTGGGDALELGAGQQASFADGTPPGPIAPVRQVGWPSGFVSLRDMPLANALAEIDRYNPGLIVLAAPEVAARRVTARIALADLEGGIEALAATENLSVTRLTSYLLVLQ
ncbi:MAG: FecR domain-containing protein [Pseudomonadota bacterium]